jgi:ABC-type glycerol-3-phosphate transport system substrate-binding protein
MRIPDPQAADPGRRVRRIVGAGAALVAVVVGLSGCLPNIPGLFQPSEVTVLSEQDTVSMEALADSYTEGRLAHVLLETMPRDRLHDRLGAEFATGLAFSDVSAMDSGWLREFGDSLAPLDVLFTRDVEDDLFPGILQDARAGARYVGMPLSSDSEILYYRTDLFGDPAEQTAFEERYGYPLAPPADWTQYRDVAEFFTRDTDGDGTTDLFGTDLKGAVATDWLAAVSQAGADAMVLDGETVTVNDPAHVAALDFYRSLVPFAPPGSARLDTAGARILFYSGSLAMMRFWGSAYPDISEQSPMRGKVGVAPMIAGPGGVAGVPRGTYLSVPRKATHKETAMDFLAHSFQRNDLVVDAPPRLPARASVFEAHAGEEGFEHYAAILATLRSPLSRPPQSMPEWQEIVDSALVPAVQQAMDGVVASQALLDAAAARTEAILAER